MAHDFVPDARDGLTTIERTLLRLALPASTSYDKARTLLDAARQIVPGHDRQLVYDALVRLAAKYLSRNPLIDGRGNYGSIDGDPPASSKYTEARRTALGGATFPGLAERPGDDAPAMPVRVRALLTTSAATPLRGAFPGVLANGAWEGISVIPPHALGELVAAVVLRLREPTCALDDLMAVLPGPDFPTAGVLPDPAEIETIYATGAGPLTIRGTTLVEAGERGRCQLVVTAVPFLATKGGDSGVIMQIADLARERTDRPITGIEDHSDRRGMRLVVELSDGVDPESMIRELHAKTDLETSIAVRMIALDAEGTPRQWRLLELLDAVVDHQRLVVRAEGVAGDAAVDDAVEARLRALADAHGNERRTTILSG